MKTILVFTLLVVLCSNPFLYGQYNYENYRFPDLKVQGLNLNFDSNGNFSKFKSSDDYSSQGLNYNIGASYFKFNNNNKKQVTDQIILQNNFNYNVTSFPPFVDSETSDFSIFISKRQINRNYLNNEPSFLGLKGRFYEVNHDITLQYYNQGSDDFASASAAVSLGYGFGRLEPVSEIFDAQFLMNDLLEAGMINSKFSEAELFELAALMANVKNQRVFDFRRALIYQLTELSSWLEAKSIPLNIRTFTILNDNWTGNFISQRLNGKRLRFKLSPWASKRWYNPGESSTFDNGGTINMTYTVAKNKSLYMGTEMTVKLSHNVTSDFFQADDLTTLAAGYSWIFNPNSRTTITSSANLAFATQKFENYTAQISIPFSFNYFINNRARIIGNLNMNWLSNDKAIFERQFVTPEFNSNFRSEVSNQNSSILNFTRSQFNISGGLNFFYTLF